MLTIIIGTNRLEARSEQLAAIYSKALTEEGVEHNILSLKDLPQDFVFSALYDNKGKNEDFNKFQVQVDGSDQFVFIVPEYNGGYPGILKAFIDGLRFPDSFRGKVGAMIGLGMGVQGGALAMSHLSDTLNHVGMVMVPIRPRIIHVDKNLLDGELKDPGTLAFIHQQIKWFKRIQINSVS